MDTIQLTTYLKNVMPQSELIAVQAMQGGVSCITHRLQLLTPDQHTRHLVLRRYRRHASSIAAQEFRLLQQLHALNIKSPQPLHLDQSGSVFPEPLIIMEYIDGVLDLAPDDLASYITQYAQQLTHIHRVDPTAHGLAFLPSAAMVCPELQQNEQPYALSDTATMRKLLTTHQPNHPNRSMLLHGDFWVGNMLWRDETLVGRDRLGGCQSWRPADRLCNKPGRNGRPVWHGCDEAIYAGVSSTDAA